MRPAWPPLAALLPALLLAAACGGTPPETPGEVAAPPAEAAPPRAARLVCPPRQARVRLAVQDPEPALSTELGIDALHARTGLPRRESAHHLALTTASIEWLSEVEVVHSRAARAGPGGGPLFCAVPGRVGLTLAVTEHRMRIAREIPEGGCLFAEVEAHERRHVAVNREALRQAARLARAAAEGWAREAEGTGTSLDDAKAVLADGLRRAVEPAMAALRLAQARGHAAIDTPAEYRRLARICPEDQLAVRRALLAAGGRRAVPAAAAPPAEAEAPAPD